MDEDLQEWMEDNSVSKDKMLRLALSYIENIGQMEEFMEELPTLIDELSDD